MLDHIIRFSVQRRWTILTLAIVAAVGGLLAIQQIPVDAVPDLSENQVIVTADWPGHGPTEIDARITSRISRTLQSLDGVRAVRGSSDMGYSLIHVIFKDEITLPEARRRVQEGITSTAAQLPDRVSPVLAPDGIATGQIYWYTVEGTNIDLAELRRCQDEEIAPLLASVPGVAEVASVGGFRSELHINLRPETLVHHKLSLTEFLRQLQHSEHGGGQVIQKEGAEFVLQLEPKSHADVDSLINDWQSRVIRSADGAPILLGELAELTIGPAPRRGTFEKEGSECVAGIVHLRYGYNVLEVTRAVRNRLVEVAASLPSGIRIVPCYDRTPLILGAVNTVSRTLLEALIIAAVCVLIVLRHFRAWLVIALTLPLCVLLTFLAIRVLSLTGILSIQTNIMSLAGIVISIGVLVDSSIVMTENVMHRLRDRFGDQPVSGDVSEDVIAACSVVGRPVFFSIVVMLISFMPVFSLQGIDGRMYGPLAWTKTLALIAAAILAVTLVPALSAILIRGRMRDETESAVVRSLLTVYRPLLERLLEKPLPLFILLCTTLILAAAPTGSANLLQCAVLLSCVILTAAKRSWKGAVACSLAMMFVGLSASTFMTPLTTELRMPLREGIVMDMPITVPRANVTQSTDDMKARNMVLCRFPEIRMVTGKAGRAATPFDPAPLDMIESMVEFFPDDVWPKRLLLAQDATRLSREFAGTLAQSGLIETIPDQQLSEITDAALFRFDAAQRETAWQLQQTFRTSLREKLCETCLLAVSDLWLSRGEIQQPLTTADAGRVQNQIVPEVLRDLEMTPSDLTVATFLRHAQRILNETDIAETADVANSGQAVFLEDSALALRAIIRTADAEWKTAARNLDETLQNRAVPTFVHVLSDEIFARTVILDDQLRKQREQVIELRKSSRKADHSGDHHHGLASYGDLPFVDPHPEYDRIREEMRERWKASLKLHRHTPETLASFGGEMDRVLQMPGWTNVWTRPIQNRVDMLATGVNSEVGVRVLGRSLNDVVDASEEIARILRDVPGAANVVADPVRGKGVVRVRPDFDKAAALGVTRDDLVSTIDYAFSGRVISETVLRQSPIPVRLNVIPGNRIADEETLREIQIPSAIISSGHKTHTAVPIGVPLDAVAEVSVEEGPATIKRENGWLRNYVRLNVRGRDPLEFVEDAKRIVSQRLSPRPGVFVEWTGQFEHAVESRRSLLILVPVVVLLIFLTLLWTYRDAADALLMLLTAPGALAGGILCQWLLGYQFSVAVGVGYIACFGMAASTGVVMLVYLREAVAAAGGLENMTLEQLRSAVLKGAVHRLRPKLLTEATTLLSLAPMIWSTGTGAEIIRPMAAPVLGGILVADEIIDLLLPILFYHVRRRRWLALHPTNKSNSSAMNKEASPGSG